MLWAEGQKVLIYFEKVLGTSILEIGGGANQLLETVAIGCKIFPKYTIFIIIFKWRRILVIFKKVILEYSCTFSVVFLCFLLLRAIKRHTSRLTN